MLRKSKKDNKNNFRQKNQNNNQRRFNNTQTEESNLLDNSNSIKSNLENE